MAVGIVHRFEAVQIADYEATGDLLMLMRVHEDAQDAVKLRPVADLGHRILRDAFRQLATLFLERDLGAGVVHEEDRSGRFPFGVENRNRVAVDRHPAIIAATDAQAAERLYAGVNRVADRAVVVADRISLFVAQVEQFRVPIAVARDSRRRLRSIAPPPDSTT